MASCILYGMVSVWYRILVHAMFPARYSVHRARRVFLDNSPFPPRTRQDIFHARLLLFVKADRKISSAGIVRQSKSANICQVQFLHFLHTFLPAPAPCRRRSSTRLARRWWKACSMATTRASLPLARPPKFVTSIFRSASPCGSCLVFFWLSLSLSAFRPPFFELRQCAGLVTASPTPHRYQRGQTGTGKTHTLIGSKDDPGLLPRTPLFQRPARQASERWGGDALPLGDFEDSPSAAVRAHRGAGRACADASCPQDGPLPLAEGAAMHALLRGDLHGQAPGPAAPGRREPAPQFAPTCSSEVSCRPNESGRVGPVPHAFNAQSD